MKKNYHTCFPYFFICIFTYLFYVVISIYLSCSGLYFVSAIFVNKCLSFSLSFLILYSPCLLLHYFNLLYNLCMFIKLMYIKSKLYKISGILPILIHLHELIKLIKFPDQCELQFELLC